MKATYSESVGNSKQKTAAERKRHGWEQHREQGRLTVQLPLPMVEALASTAEVIERMAREVGLLVAQAVLEDEVDRRAGPRHSQALDAPYRWGRDEGYLL